MKTVFVTNLLILLVTQNIPISDAGTLRNLVTSCTDGGADHCHQFADCFELSEGAFECICRDGYTGDGKLTCEDANECALTGDDHPCPSEDTGGYCVNSFVHDANEVTASLEGYKCGCDPKKGVTDGPESNVHGPMSCIDVNECLDPALNNCGENSACTNTFASFYCECLVGYTMKEKNVCEKNVIVEIDSGGYPSVAPSHASICPATEIEHLVCFDDFEDGSGVAHGWQDWTVDYTLKDTAFTTFLGRFNQNSAFPYKKFDIPFGTQRVFVSFDFLEIDSWDGDNPANEDKLGIKFESETEGELVTLDFGAFHYTIDEGTRDGVVDGISWTLTSTPIAASPQGFLNFTDQMHHVSIEVGSNVYSDKGDVLKATIEWSLMGDLDESVGIDNFRVVVCEDTVPSAAPSLVPSVAPSSNPSDEPPRTPRGGGGGGGGGGAESPTFDEFGECGGPC